MVFVLYIVLVVVITMFQMTMNETEGVSNCKLRVDKYKQHI